MFNVACSVSPRAVYLRGITRVRLALSSSVLTYPQSGSAFASIYRHTFFECGLYTRVGHQQIEVSSFVVPFYPWNQIPLPEQFLSCQLPFFGYSLATDEREKKLGT